MTQEEAINTVHVALRYPTSENLENARKVIDVILANTLPETGNDVSELTIVMCKSGSYRAFAESDKLGSFDSVALYPTPRAAVMAAIQQIKEG